MFDALPDGIQGIVVDTVGLFVGDGWHLTLGALFMITVIFLPGGIMEGVRRIGGIFTRSGSKSKVASSSAVASQS